MKVVKVYGALKKRLGGQGTFKFDVNTPGEAIRALCANFPGLDRWLVESKDKGVGYKTLIGKERITEDNAEKLIMPWSEKDVFKITPVVVGSGGKGFGAVLLGVALIGASFLFPGAGLFGATGLFGAGGAGVVGVSSATVLTMTKIGTALSYMGAAMILSGVGEMLSPMPEMPGTSPEANLIKNYSFSGIQNTTPQGFPVPICYGRCITGSAVISASLDVV